MFNAFWKACFTVMTSIFVGLSTIILTKFFFYVVLALILNDIFSGAVPGHR